jgi:hypothetical protein
MTLKWMDGAEIWAASGYQSRGYLAGSTGFTASARISPGTQAMTFNGTSLTTPSLGEQNTWIVGFGFKLSGNAGEWRFLDAGVDQCSLEIHDNGDSTFEWKMMRGATELERTAESFAKDVWHYFEAKVTVRTGANGAYELRHNENNVMSDTGVNLADTGSDGCDAHQWGLAPAAQIITMDDIYICDDQGSTNNNFLGDSVIVGLLTQAEGNQNDFTPSTGTDNEALVDDPSNSPSTADYVSSDTVAHQDFYTYDNLPATGLGTIFGIRVVTDAAMQTAGSRTLKPKFRAASTSEGDGTTFAVDGVTVLSYPIIMEQDPVAVGAWTKTEIDGGEFGIEVVS